MCLFAQKLVFNSKTNCLDQRKFLHCGTLYKHKSSKELVGFLFNDFLLLTVSTKPLNIPVNDLMFSSKANLQFRMYKQVSCCCEKIAARTIAGFLGSGGKSFWGKRFLFSLHV